MNGGAREMEPYPTQLTGLQEQILQSASRLIMEKLSALRSNISLEGLTQ
jgi:hypothetical protein